jgi:hypothetical protein
MIFLGVRRFALRRVAMGSMVKFGIPPQEDASECGRYLWSENRRAFCLQHAESDGAENGRSFDFEDLDSIEQSLKDSGG